MIIGGGFECRCAVLSLRVQVSTVRFVGDADKYYMRLYDAQAD